MREMRETMTRVMTGKLIDMADDCVISWESVALACLNYMSEADVADMARCEFDMTDDDDEADDDDDEAETGL